LKLEREESEAIAGLVVNDWSGGKSGHHRADWLWTQLRVTGRQCHRKRAA